MLDVKVLDSAQALTERYDQLDVAVFPKSGTPLALLVNQCNVSNLHVDTSNEHISFYTGEKSIVTGLNQHEIDLKNIPLEVAQDVRNHLKFARTVVAPDVTHFVEALTPGVLEIARNPLYDVEVVVNNAYSFLYEPALSDDIAKFKDTPVLDVSLNFKLDARTDEEVLLLMGSGSASLDQAVAVYASKLEAGALAHIWATMFTQVPQADGDQNYGFQQLLNQQNFGITRALVTYLVARKLWNNPPDDANMSAKAYENLMVDFRNQAGLALLREQYRQERALSSGTLVEAIYPNKVVVNGNVYKQWVDNGGKNEVLLGLSLSNQPARLVDDIDAKADAYLNAWKNHVALSQVTIRNRQFTRTKELINVEFGHYLKNVPLEELSLSERPNVAARFKEALSKIKLEDAEPSNLYNLVLDLLCYSRYYKTGAHFILHAVQRVAKTNPELTARQAASIATVEYIARWVGSMLDVQSIKRYQPSNAR